MDTDGRNGVGRFLVDIVVSNYIDVNEMNLGRLRPDQVRREIVPAVVDTGAVKLSLPQTVVERLGLSVGKGHVAVRYADGRRDTREITGAVYIDVLGRGDVFSAVIEPDRTTALLGAIVLEDLDLLVDCKLQRLMPRDPVVVELES
jgi:hypothetical protein